MVFCRSHSYYDSSAGRRVFNGIVEKIDQDLAHDRAICLNYCGFAALDQEMLPFFFGKHFYQGTHLPHKGQGHDSGGYQLDLAGIGAGYGNFTGNFYTVWKNAFDFAATSCGTTSKIPSLSNGGLALTALLVVAIAFSRRRAANQIRSCVAGRRGRRIAFLAYRGRLGQRT